MHERGIAHRDIKPENLLILLGKNELKVVDFGIARAISTNTEEASSVFRSARGSIMGSPAYIAPETVCGDPADERTDLYSAGIVLFEMLTGDKPFRASSPYALLKEHLVSVPKTLKAAKPETYWCPELEQLIARLLAKRPDDRPASCCVVLEELRGGLTQRVLESIAMSPPPKKTKPASDSARPPAGLLNRFFKKS